MVKRLAASLAEAVSNLGGTVHPVLALLRSSSRVTRCPPTVHTGQYASLREVPLFAGVLYYGLTTVLRRPTVGEEYCDIVPVSTRAATRAQSAATQTYSLESDPDGTRCQLHEGGPASSRRRMALLLVHLGAPYLLRGFVERMRRGPNGGPEVCAADVIAIALHRKREKKKRYKPHRCDRSGIGGVEVARPTGVAGLLRHPSAHGGLLFHGALLLAQLPLIRTRVWPYEGGSRRKVVSLLFGFIKPQLWFGII